MNIRVLTKAKATPYQKKKKEEAKATLLHNIKMRNVNWSPKSIC